MVICGTGRGWDGSPSKRIASGVGERTWPLSRRGCAGWAGVIAMASEPQNFSTAVAEEFLQEAKEQLHVAREDAPEQLDLLAVPTPEEMADARAKVPNGAPRDVLRIARSGPGRKPGSRNKSTQEFKRWILSYGQHPAVTLMQIQATPPEVLMENSRREYQRLDRHGNPVTIVVEMSYGEAQGLRKQCAAELMPFIESKQPVAVDMSFSGLSDLVMMGVTHSEAEVHEVLEADFVSVDDADWGAPE